MSNDNAVKDPGIQPLTPLTPGSRRPLSLIGMVVVGVGALVTALLILSVPLGREVIGFLVILLVILLLLLGMPIAIAMILGATVGLLVLAGPNVLMATLEDTVYSSAASWQLSVVPMFILMGIALWRSGLTGGAYEAARQWLGKLPGGLAVGTNFAGAGLAAASGSTVGIAFALGRIAIPEMLRAGYKPSLATAVVAMAGTLGQLIPPSVMLVVYAGIAQTQVGLQLISAIVPGLIIALVYGLLIVIRAAVTPGLAPKVNLVGVTWGSRFRSLVGILPVVLVVVIVIGGLFGGIFTPTEAGAFGALAAILCGWLLTGRQNRNIRFLASFVGKSLVDTAVATATIFFLIMGVEVLTQAMTLSRVANTLSEIVVALEFGRVELLLALVVVYIILGMFLDPLAMMLLTLPVLSAPLATLGVDMIWFGVFMVIMAEIAIVTPPIGMLTFIVHRLAQDPEVGLGQRISLIEVFKGVLWFVGAALAVVVLLIVFPEIVSWLPSLSSAAG